LKWFLNSWLPDFEREKNLNQKKLLFSAAFCSRYRAFMIFPLFSYPE
jgi:hypothetical protein